MLTAKKKKNANYCWRVRRSSSVPFYFLSCPQASALRPQIQSKSERMAEWAQWLMCPHPVLLFHLIYKCNNKVNDDWKFEKSKIAFSSALEFIWSHMYAEIIHPSTQTDYFLQFIAMHPMDTSLHFTGSCTLYCLLNYAEQCDLSRWFLYCVL